MGELDRSALVGEVELFSVQTGSRDKNDINNKKREAILETLFSEKSTDVEYFLNNPKFGNFWHKIRNSISSELGSHFYGKNQDFGSLVLKRKAGRGFNYDFAASFSSSMASNNVEFQLEFKKGKSIYDQPQFWSLPAKESKLISSGVRPYGEFFYSKYIHELESIAGTKAPQLPDYMSSVYKINYEQHEFFRKLRELSKASKSTLAKLHKLKNLSIHLYLEQLIEEEGSIDFVNIQSKLTEQTKKLFCSWDYKSQTLSIEQFSVADVSIKREVHLKPNPNKFINTLIFNTQSGKEIHALLRWRNGPCILMPAWQIKMSEKPVKRSKKAEPV